MEYLEGETLRHALERRGSFPEREVIEIGIQICDALAAAHANGIIHRDIKPDNIMISEEEFVKVMDFGLAKLKQVEKKLDTDKIDLSNILSKNISLKTSVSTLLGTANYMSPEQINGEPVDERSDIFSFGIVLFEMSTGLAPFEGENSTDVLRSIIEVEPKPLEHYNPEISPQLKEIIFKAMKKKPENRFQNMKEILSVLNDIKEKNFEQQRQRISDEKINLGKPWKQKKIVAPIIMIILLGIVWVLFFEKPFLLTENLGSIGFLNKNDNKYVIAVAPFWSIDENAAKVGKNFQKFVAQELNKVFKNEKKIKILADEKVQILQSHDEANIYGNMLGAEVVVWGKVRNYPDKINYQSCFTFIPNPKRKDQLLVDLGDGNKIEFEYINETQIGKIINYLSAKYYTHFKDFKKSLSIINKVDCLYPEFMILKAQNLNGQEKYSESIAIYKNIFNEYTDSIKVDLVFGSIAYNYFLLDNVDSADKYIQKAIKAKPEGHQKMAGSIYTKQGKYNDAIFYYHQAIQLDFQNSNLHHSLGYCYFMQMDFDKALKAYKQALKLNIEFDDFFYDLGTLNQYMNRFCEAIAAYKKCLKINPQKDWCHHNMGLIYLNQDKYNKAVREFKKAIKLNPNIEYHLNGLAISHMAKGFINKALKVSEQSLQINSQNPSSNLIYFIILYRYGKSMDALNHLLKFRKTLNNDNFYSLTTS